MAGYLEAQDEAKETLHSFDDGETWQRAKPIDATYLYSGDGPPGVNSPSGGTMVLTEAGWLTQDELPGLGGNLPGIGAGVAQGVANMIGDPELPAPEINPLSGELSRYLGGLKEGQDETDVAIGQGLVNVGGALVGSKFGRSIPLGSLPEQFPKLAKGVETVLDATGSAVGASLADDDPTVESVGFDIGADAALTGLASVIAPRAERIWNAIKGVRPSRRAVGLGDGVQPDVAGKESLERLQDQGYEITPGQASGNRDELLAEDAARKKIGETGTFVEIDNNNQAILNEKVATSIGSDPRFQLTPTVIDDAGGEIGKEINTLVSNLGPLDVPDSMTKTLTDIAERQGIEGSTRGIAKDTLKLFDQIKAQGRKMTPDEWAEVRSGLVNELADTSNTNTRNQLIKMVDQWTDIPTLTMARQGADPGKVKAFNAAYDDARDRYRNWLAVKANNVVDGAGNVRPRSLNQALQRTYKDTFKLARSTSNPAVVDLHQFTRDINMPRAIAQSGDSGTAARMQNQFMEDRNIQTVKDLGTGLATGDAVSPAANIAVRTATKLQQPYNFAPETSDISKTASRAIGFSLAEFLSPSIEQ
tara:strand:+ start:4549 stop:6315 length:1767 start_codon:yes stop_codon:yes gene_type:complete